MRALVACWEPPHPEGGPAARCAEGMLEGLAGHGLELVVVSGPGAAVPSRHYTLHAARPRDPEPRWSRVLHSLRRPGATAARNGLGELVRAHAAGADVVHLEQVATAWADEGVRRPSLVHVHCLTRTDRDVPAPWRNEFRFYLESTAADRIAVRRHDFLVASSPDVAAALRSLKPRADVTLAPLTLPAGGYAPAGLDGPPVAGIIGTGSWPPTARAIERLVTQVWPRVARALPEARLRVAGRHLDWVQALRDAPPSVDVLGEVPSAGEFLRDLSLLLYPLERGTGMKVKVLEAVASGLPVVTTPAGAEGMEGGDAVVVCSTDDELIRSAVSLLSDPDERRARGRAGARAFAARYAPGPATQPLVDLYRRMLERAA